MPEYSPGNPFAPGGKYSPENPFAPKEGPGLVRRSLRKLGELGNRIAAGGGSAATFGLSPKAALMGMGQGASLGFADELLGSAYGAVMPGVSMQEGRDKYRAELEEEKKAHRVSAGVGSLLGTLAPAMGTGGIGLVKGAALLGGVDAAGNAEGGLGERLPAAALGAGAGAALGGAASGLLRLGGKKALALGGTAAGAAAGDNNAERLQYAVGGGLGGLGAAKLGGGLLRKLSGTPPAKVAEEKFLRSLLKTRLGTGARATPAALREAAATALPGETALELGAPNNPLVRLAGSAYRQGGEGGAAIGAFAAEHGRVSTPAAEKSVRKALHSNYRETPKAVTETKRLIQQETKPLYDAVRGVEVDAAPLVRLAQEEPLVADVWKEAQALATSRQRAGLNAVDMPDLELPNGEAIQRIPVLGLDLMKQALRDLIQRRAQSTSPITSGQAEVLNVRLGQLMAAAKRESPEFAAALKNFGEVEGKYVGSIAKQKQNAEAIIGNSKTAERVAEDAKEFGSPGNLSLNPKQWWNEFLNSRVGRLFNDLDDETVVELAPMLTKELRGEGGRQLAGQLEDYLQWRIQQMARRGLLPRGAAAGAGALIGSQYDQ